MPFLPLVNEKQALHAHPLAKFGLVAILAVTASFAMRIALRRVPGLKSIL